MMRLDRFLANQGIGTRKEVKKLIRSGIVKIDGVIVDREDVKFDENHSVVTLRGEPLVYQKDVYLLFHKPQGCVCANQDAMHATVFDYLPAAYRRLFVVGRLDKDTSGLLLITNDGVLAHRLLTPAHHVYKGYEVLLRDTVTKEQLAMLSEGIDLGDFTTLPAKVNVVDARRIHLFICEGKFHQVKRMLAAVGNEVLALHRFSFGPLCLGELEREAWRPLDDQEIASLREVSQS